MEDDSDYSDNDVDVEDRIKLVKALPVEIGRIGCEEKAVEDSLRVCEVLSQTKLKRVPGKVKALECHWAFPELLMYDHHRMYAGLGEEMDLEELSERLMHQHQVQDQDREGFWDEILAYLHLEWLPKSQFEAEKIKRRARRFFILNDVLWHKNGTKPPLLEILINDIRLRIAKDTHDDIGH